MFSLVRNFRHAESDENFLCNYYLLIELYTNYKAIYGVQYTMYDCFSVTEFSVGSS